MTAMQKKFAVPGPWDLEPDYLDGVHKNISWQIKRNPSMGFLLGYISIPETSRVSLKSPYHEYMELYFPRGGITYEHTENNVTTYGFDCGHYDQIIPVMMGIEVFSIEKNPHAKYVDIKTVKTEIEKMIDSLYDRL